MKKMKTQAFANLICALIFAGIAVYAIVVSMGFRQFKNSTVNPSVFPQIMAGGLLVCAVILLIQSIIRLPKDTTQAPTLSLRDRGIRHMLLCIVITIAYTFLWEYVGFLILATITMMILMYLIDMRKPVLMIVVSVVLPVVIWLLFYKVLSIAVPLGPLEIIYDVF